MLWKWVAFLSWSLGCWAGWQCRAELDKPIAAVSWVEPYQQQDLTKFIRTLLRESRRETGGCLRGHQPIG